MTDCRISDKNWIEGIVITIRAEDPEIVGELYYIKDVFFYRTRNKPQTSMYKIKILAIFLHKNFQVNIYTSEHPWGALIKNSLIQPNPTVCSKSRVQFKALCRIGLAFKSIYTSYKMTQHAPLLRIFASLNMQSV